MKCPRCLLPVHESWVQLNQAPMTGDERVLVERMACPNCDRLLVRATMTTSGPLPGLWTPVGLAWFVVPRSTSRPAPPEVPEPYRLDYGEAAEALHYSEKASAALSRKLIQDLLRDKGGYAQRDLSVQIDAFRADTENPRRLRDNLHYISEIGNFAVHTQKSVATGEILPIEVGEAEWCLEVLDDLFEYYFVEPAQDAERRSQLEAKIAAAGRRSLPQAE